MPDIGCPQPGIIELGAEPGEWAGDAACARRQQRPRRDAGAEGGLQQQKRRAGYPVTNAAQVGAEDPVGGDPHPVQLQ